jgi:hypothetical protein
MTQSDKIWFMRRVVVGLVFGAMVLVASAAAPVPAKQSSVDKANSRTIKSRSAKRAPVRRVVSRRKVNGRWVTVTRVVRASPGPSYQLHPDPERYQEIQKSLAERGYFKGDVNGQWGDDSTDALRRFQEDQKLPVADGKISARSLTGLGLGAKHDGSSVPPSVSSGPPSSGPPVVPPPPVEPPPQPTSEPPPVS